MIQTELLYIFAAIACGSFLVCAGLTYIVRRLVLRTDFVARPSADRYHSSIVPLGGGIAIFVTIAAFLVGAAVFSRVAEPQFFGEAAAEHIGGFLKMTGPLLVVLLCGLGLFLMGLFDDLKSLGPKVKLIGQFVAAAAVVFLTDTRISFFIHNELITGAITVFWIVLIINAFNFLDNMDGLSAGIAVIAVSILTAAAVMSGQVFVSAMGAILIGSLLGFLLFNFPPARIFMGDAGSLVIGFFVAILTVRTTYYQQAMSGQWYSVFLPIIVMAVPLYDFLSVTVLRISQGKSPFVGDTQHFSHRLKRHGLTDTQTALTLYLATLCTGLGATFLYQVNLVGAVLIFLQTFAILAIIAIFESTVKNDLETSRK